MVVCDEGHSLLADPWERGRPTEILGPCCVCGAVARLQEHGGQERPTPPTSPPGYDILGPLQGGVMAGVYRARHRRSGRLVALKLSTSGQDGGRGRIRREAQTLGGLDHPNVVRLLDVGEAGHLAFFSMEWLPGGTLSDRLCGGPLAPSEAVRMAAKLADAAHHAHGRRVIHRDIRPSNIVFTVRGEPVLVDFGIAKRLGRPHGTIRDGAMVGDPRYMAPEQSFDGAQRVGPAVDVHGIGAVLYHALTGCLPFQEVCFLERLRVADAPVPPPTAIWPSLPTALDRICLRCLHREPEGRYATAAELADDLRGVYGSRCCPER
jgi:serine/threonine-protein kinase